MGCETLQEFINRFKSNQAKDYFETLQLNNDVGTVLENTSLKGNVNSGNNLSTVLKEPIFIPASHTNVPAVD